MRECAEYLEHFAPELVYVPADPSKFYLEERSKGGEGKTYFSSRSPCIVIRAQPAGPLIWSLRNRKIGEGAIITKDETGFHLHILEMKSKLTQATWAEALLQLEGMHLTTLAVTRLLGIEEIGSVTCYIAYKQDAMAANKSADMVLMKTFVGQPNPVGGVDAWQSESIDLPFTGRATIRKAQRDANHDADFGAIN